MPMSFRDSTISGRILNYLHRTFLLWRIKIVLSSALCERYHRTRKDTACSLANDIVLLNFPKCIWSKLLSWS